MENSINLKILGTVSPYCKGDHNCPGYLFEYKNNKILLDCGNGITRYMNMPKDLLNLHIFISHYHKDHYCDLLSIGYASYVYHNNGELKHRIKVYLPIVDKTSKEYEDYKFISSLKEQFFEFILYDENSKYEIDDLSISFMRNTHSTLTFSTKLQNESKKIIYSADIGYKSIEDMINFSIDADLLICESSFIKEHKIKNDNHLHAHQSALFAKEANVKKLILTHFWPETPKVKYLNEAKQIFNDVQIAEENKIFIL